MAQSRYATEGLRIAGIAEAQGYTAVRIDYEPARLGRKSGGYEITARHDNNVRVLIARNTSWAKTYADALEYLAE